MAGAPDLSMKTLLPIPVTTVLLSAATSTGLPSHRATEQPAQMSSSSLTLHAQWPQFRGPDGTGVSASTNLPLTWGEGKNVRWKTAIHGRAWSSPVILGNQVWVTTATQDGRELSAIAVDRDSGKI